jgi:hypothetical protein
VPLKLNIGVSRKVGLPDYSSAGATCNVELELDSALLERDLDGFHAKVRVAYIAAEQAVHEELARLGVGPNGRSEPSPEPARAERNGSNDRVHRQPTNGLAADGNGAGGREHRGTWGTGQPAPKAKAGGSRRPRPATSKQINAIESIARRRGVDLDALLADCHVQSLDELSISQASSLIDQLKSDGDVS